MKRIILLLFCLLLGCTSAFTSIDPADYRAEAVLPVLSETTELPVPIEPTAALWNEPTPEPTEPPLLRERYAIPETVRFDYSEGKITITGNAIVHVPDVSELPSARVFASSFDQKTVDRLYDACFPDGGTFDYSDQTAYSRAEIEGMLGVLDRYAQMSRVKSVVYRCETERKRLEKLLPTAPETVLRTPTRPVLQDGAATVQTANEWGYGDVFAVSNEDAGGAASFSCLYEMDPTLNFLDTQNKNYRRDVTKESRVRGLLPEGCTMETDPFSAVESVQRFLTDAGLDDFSAERVALYANSRSYPQWYRISCKRTVGGVSITTVYPADSLHGTRRTSAAKTRSTEEWKYERLVFLVADTGIRRIFWEDPVSVERLSGSGPELIPFREAVEIAQTILYEADKDRTVSITDTVESIALTMLIESDPETDGTGKLIPAWEVCFTKTMGSQGVSRGLQSIFIRADTGEALVWTAGVFCRDAACATGLDHVPAVLGNYKVAE